METAVSVKKSKRGNWDYYSKVNSFLDPFRHVKMQKKSEIREQMLTRRLAMDQDVKKHGEDSIRKNIQGLQAFQKVKVVASYIPVRGEVDLLSLWQECVDKTILFPKVEGEALAFYPAKCMDDFCSGCFGIPEPVCTEPFNIKDINMFLVPGIAFDRKGYRLGYGKGFYDKLLSSYPDILTIGICLDEFLVDKLPVEPWDAQVKFIVTQTGVYKTEGEVQ